MIKSILKQLGIALGVFLVGSLAVILISSAQVWNAPGGAPPTANAPAPLNVSSVGQTKVGGLTLNTGGAPTGLIVASGNVGIGTTNPSQKLDVAGYVKGQAGLCIGSDCRTSWPVGGGGTGTVTSISQGFGIILTPNPITATGLVAVDPNAVRGGEVTYTSPGSYSFTVPAGRTTVFVTGCGGGGGGGSGSGSTTFDQGAGGGGGGAHCVIAQPVTGYGSIGRNLYDFCWRRRRRRFQRHLR